MPGPMLYLTEPENSEEATSDKVTKENPDDKDVAKNKTTEADKNNGDWDLYAITKGSKGSGNGSGKGKGYGECWHCGEWGHPRRECPQLHGQQGQKGSLAALKGYKGGGGKGRGKKGKGGKGYGNKGKGKGGKSGGYYNYNYRSPGKSAGKGLNYMSDDWFNAWGDEGSNDNYQDDWYYVYGEQDFGYLGNVAMMLERGGTTAKTKTTTSTTDAQLGGLPTTGASKTNRNASKCTVGEQLTKKK